MDHEMTSWISNISVTDPLNHVTSFGYDAADNRISTTDAMNRTAHAV
jgi:YD repeat-containing protein